MHDPEEIEVSKRNTSAENVSHHYYTVMAKDKYLCLKRICDIYPNIYGIVFCQTRTDTKEVADKLIHDGYNADALHGDLSQAQRDMVMNRFRIRNLQILVATDVAARGLDVSDISHIINYSMPMESDIYIHRSGRTGRAGKSGISISLVHSREFSKLRQIEKLVGSRFEHKKVPTGKEICEKQLFNVIDQLEKVEVDEKQIEQFLPAIYSKLSWLSREELIKRFVSEEFNRFSHYYKDAEDISIPEPERRGESTGRRSRDGERDRERGSGKGRDTNFARIYLNVGSNNRVNPTSIIGIINNSPDLRNAEVGRIEIMKKCTFFEIDKKFEHIIGTALKNSTFDGVSLVADIAIPKSETGDGSGFRNKRNDFQDNQSGYARRKERPANDGDRSWERKKEKPASSESGFESAKRKPKEFVEPNWQKDKKTSLKGKKEKKSDKKSDSKGPKKERKNWFD
jgi:ATP-dependent RNA helicase DeaD